MSFLSENLRPFRRSRAETPCEWLIEPLRSRPEFSVRRTFGCWSFYLGEKNVLLYVPAGDEDGEGILIPTSPEFHASLIAEFPGLAPHDFLKKWLCLGANADDYEETAAAIVDGDGVATEVTLVGTTETNSLEHKISNESPVGRAIIGHAAGETVEVVTPSGKTRLYTITNITR